MKELTKDEIEDKIFELEMEQKELSWHQDIWYKMIDEDGIDFLYESSEQVDKLIEENQCWLSYYQELLKDMEQGEKYDE